ncbi:MAG: hypothetical protein KDK70_22845 [Myxococcales bacterium]|nr:hypothetical protein [Myxococcales bacterium]
MQKRRRDLERAHQKVLEIIEAGGVPSEDDFAPVWRVYRDLLGEAQHDKCAYCETRFRASYRGAVEHHRPKTAIQEITRLTRDRIVPGPTRRPGYWWLAYRFENWVLSCFDCNAAKGNYFPVRRRNKVIKPRAELSENPWLIDPLRHDPAGAFRFDEFGGIHAQRRTAAYTLRVCKLDRGLLEQERKRTAQALVRDLEDYENAVVSRNDAARRTALRRIKEACAPDAPYAAMTRQLVEERVFLDWPTLSRI